MGLFFNRRNPKWRKTTCEGTITEFKLNGMDSPMTVCVSYTVDGVEYQLKEAVKLISVTRKAGPIPIGQRKVPVLPDVSPGAKVVVCYNPAKPKKAYLRDNVGRITN